MSSALRRSDFSFASSQALSFPISDRECTFTLPSIISGRVRASSFLNTEICPLCSRKQKFSCNIEKIAEFKKQTGESILTDAIKETENVFDTREFFIENERYKITAGLHGVKNIYDKSLKMDICGETEYMPFEFILEHDDGSPWATMSSDLRRTTFRKETLLTQIETSENCSKIKFKIIFATAAKA